MAEKLVPLAGSVPFNKHPKVGPVDDKERIEVTIKLRRKTQGGLPTVEEFLDGKRATGVTRGVLADRYGASSEDIDAVQRWAVQKGLSVSRAEAGMRQVHVVGSAAAMSAAFGVKLSTYKHARRGVDFRCPEGEVYIPESLKGVITGVFGLNTMPIMVRHSHRVGRKAAAADPKTLWPDSFYPQEVAKLYNFPAGGGAGQRVAVLEFGGGFDPTVLQDYFTQTIGLPISPTVNSIPVLGVQNVLDQEVTGEVYLDIEVIGAMAPNATIDVYFAPWTGEGFLNAIEQAIHNDDYSAISISYGFDEDMQGSPGNPAWPMLKASVDEAFSEAVAVGVPVFVSSGDQGSSSQRGQVQNQEVTVLAPAAHAAYPSTSPYATSVGGTLLYAANGAITQEVVWNELGDLQQGQFYFGGATGGGVSDRYSKAPSYQTSADVKLSSVNTPPATGRCIPDVAGNAGASTGYLVSQPPGSQVQIAPVGGTSAAAPMWAALMACVRTALSAANPGGATPNFFFNDFVYAVGQTKAFNDIVGGREFTLDPTRGDLTPGAFKAVGDNRSSQADGYYAQKGYDLCTGWGTPNGVELLAQLQNWLAARPPAAAPTSQP